MWRLFWRALPLAALVATACGQSDAVEQSNARVVNVLDGDSLVVDRAGDEVEVRLRGIDAPEYRQPYASVARRALAKLASNEHVSLTVRETDRYGREVAIVVREKDGLNINRRLVEDGHAWVYTRYATDKALPGLERAARESKRGLWALPPAKRTPPWDWRETERQRKN